MRRLGLIVSVAAGAVGFFGADLAEGAIVSGSNLATEPTRGICFATQPGEPHSCSTVNVALPASHAAAGGATAAADGVIVSWSVRKGPSIYLAKVAPLVVHGANEASVGEEVTLPLASGVYSFPARLAVSRGDRLGVQIYEAEYPEMLAIYEESVPGALTYRWDPLLTPGAPRPQTGEYVGFETTMNATIEPDADHDGYGDETQDQCATSAAPGPCAPPPSTSTQRPDTAITQGPKGTIHSRTAVFAFRSDPAGAEFECKFDGRKFKACSSPRKYKHLGLGKHKFQVRAVNAAGSDSIPAARSFKIAP